MIQVNDGLELVDGAARNFWIRVIQNRQHQVNFILMNLLTDQPADQQQEIGFARWAASLELLFLGPQQLQGVDVPVFIAIDTFQFHKETPRDAST